MNFDTKKGAIGVQDDKNLVRISKEEIASFGNDFFDGRIITINTKEEVRKAIEYISKFNIVGIDTESKPSFKKGGKNRISLLQIATEECSFLIRLNYVGLTREIVNFFENDNIKKIGLSLKDDFFALHKLSEFTPKGFIDIQDIIESFGIGDKSLQKIYAILFGKKISKSQRLSNWEAEVLSDAQKRYAATDAWAVLKIYNKLIADN